MHVDTLEKYHQATGEEELCNKSPRERTRRSPYSWKSPKKKTRSEQEVDGARPRHMMNTAQRGVVFMSLDTCG